MLPVTTRQMGRDIVVTGFEAFGGITHNPSAAVLRLLPDVLHGRPVRKVVLPVDCRRLPAALAALYENPPLIVLHTGLSFECASLTIERRARNRLDFATPDNAGNTVTNEPIVLGATEFLPARLPIDEILGELEAAGISASCSEDAGSFLCNQACFYSLHHLPPAVKVGFVHLPPDEELNDILCVPYETLFNMARALSLMLKVGLGS